ncbi:MAG: glycosyltransferase family 4 protein [Rhodospirillales bacterium]
MPTSYADETWMLLDSRGIGGIESHVLHLAAGLQYRWGNVRVVFLENHGKHPLIERLDEEGISWEHLNGTLRSLLAAMRRRPMLLHTHGYKAGILGRIAALIRRVPVVSTFHAGEPGVGRVHLYNTLDLLTAGIGTSIAVSTPIKDRIPGPAHLVHNFVPVPNHPNGAKAPVIAFVGRLSHEKGPDLFCQLAAQVPNAPFAIYGDGPMRGALEKRYGGDVFFKGEVSDMERHWGDIGLVCMPSRHEGLPYTVLEAMAHGIPVAAFGVGDLPRVIAHGQNGWLAAPGNIKELANHLRQWSTLERGHLDEISAKARGTIRDQYSTDAVIPRIIRIYQETIANGAAKPTLGITGKTAC